VEWCTAVVSNVEISPDLPDLLVVNVQELGGKHKENLALMLRQGDILPKTFSTLSQRIRELYKCAGSEVWISKLCMPGYAPAGFSMDPHSRSGLRKQDFSKQVSPTTDPHAKSAAWAQSEAAANAAVDDWGAALIPEGDPEGFTGLGTIYIAKVAVLDSGLLRLVNYETKELVDPRTHLLKWSDDLCSFLPAHVIRHAKVFFFFFNIRPYTSIHDPINSMHFQTHAHLHTRTGAYCKDAAPRYDRCINDATHRHKKKQSAKLACID